MKKVLILTYYWPPAGGAGVQRWLKFVKYMPQYGWEPVVYTAANGEMPVIDESLQKDVPAAITVLKTPIWEPYTIYKRFIGRKKEDRINASFLTENKKTGLAEKISVWIRGNFFIPDARRFWIKPSVRYLSSYLEKNDVSYVISSGPPHSMHLIALGLKKRFPSLKWIADFRDPWTNIDFYEKLMLTGFADRLHRRMERSVLAGADAVVSVGNHMNDELREIYTMAGGKNTPKFHVITNGFDQDDIGLPGMARDHKFSIGHIGTLVKDRDPQVLWRVLSKICRQDPVFAQQLEIKLVGKVDIYVKEEIARHGLDPYVRAIAYLPHDQVIREQERSRVLLLLVNRTKNARGIITGKVFEYMAAGAPVLAIGPPDGELAALLDRTGTGFISGFDDDGTLESLVLTLYKGELPSRKEEQIAAYSRKALTGKLCALLDRL